MTTLTAEQHASASRTTDATAAGTAAVEIHCPEGSWVPVCGPDDLLPGRGVAALLPDGAQAALFLDRGGRIHAIATATRSPAPRSSPAA